MDDAQVKRSLERVLAELVIDSGAAPGGTIALAVVRPEGVRMAVAAAGRLTRTAHAPRVAPDTPYDLASLTKPVFALSVARLAARKELSLAAPLASWLAEAEGTPSEDVPLELLLAHRAGLESHRMFYRSLAARRPFERSHALTEACSARRPDAGGAVPRDGFAPLYSDLGFLLAGAAVERRLGRALDAIVHDEVSLPLGLDIASARTWRRRDRAFSARVAPTETVPWRGGPVRGVVHDENAWALSGHAMAGHAGLFGTAASVAELGAVLLTTLAGRSSEWLSAADLEPLVRTRPSGTLRAGFDGRSEGASVSGARSGPRTFGHLGFTGTSLWCDPDHGIVTVLLTNRVCPSRDDIRLRVARPAVQDALYAIADHFRG